MSDELSRLLFTTPLQNLSSEPFEDVNITAYDFKPHLLRPMKIFLTLDLMTNGKTKKELQRCMNKNTVPWEGKITKIQSKILESLAR